MEIAPVAGIRVVAMPKARAVDAELTARFDIEAPARPGDDTYSGNRRKAAGAEEPDDAEEPEGIDEPEESLYEDTAARVAAHHGHAPEKNPPGQISLFA